MAQGRIQSYFMAVRRSPRRSNIQGFSAQEYVAQKVCSSSVIALGEQRDSGRESATTHSADVVQLMAVKARLASSSLYRSCLLGGGYQVEGGAPATAVAAAEDSFRWAVEGETAEAFVRLVNRLRYQRPSHGLLAGDKSSRGHEDP